MTRLVLVGAGGAGRETLSFIRASSSFLDRHSIESIVFVDDLQTEAAVPVVATVGDFAPRPDDLVLCTINHPPTRSAVTTLLGSRGARFATFIHPTTFVGERVSVGAGTIAYPHSVLTADITLGEHTFINATAVVGHDVVVGDVVTIGCGVKLLGGVRVSDQAWFGAAATALPGARVGERARVGAGSVVLRRVRPDATVFGNPARVISAVER